MKSFFTLAIIAILTTFTLALNDIAVPANVDDESAVLRAFSQFESLYNYTFDNEERPLRVANFLETLRRINERNAARVTADDALFGITPFSHLTPAEFSSMYLNNAETKKVKRNTDTNALKALAADATSIDWRQKGAVTPVKNQAQCGSCWAFSVTEALESFTILAGKATNTTIDLAPQQLVDCVGFPSMGCNGGFVSFAWNYILKNGLESEKDYPYQARDGTCKGEKSKAAAHAKSWVDADDWWNEEELRKFILSKGPPSICVDASAWQDYQSGIMSANTCCAYFCQLNHCVQAVGLEAGSTTPYWVVRNSWTTQWGEQGYIRLQYGHDTCGIAHDSTAPVI